ncbi:MAG: hypothetical protein H6733_00515 [Alphaproteobacteria bacterium]|nr:hypothetical protein [Alphaproteobacteria bacterium]
MSTLTDTHPLALRDAEVPRGFIVDGPARDRARRFAVAVPTLLVLFAVTAIAGAAVVVAGANGLLDTADPTWWIAVPALSVTSAAAGAVATRAGWSRDRRAGPWRPLLYGLIAALSVALVTGSGLWLAALTT